MCEIVENAAEKIAERKTKEAHINDMLNSVKNIMDTLKLSVDQAMDALKIPISEREFLREKI